jgi:ferredoxin-like protein FixX
MITSSNLRFMSQRGPLREPAVSCTLCPSGVFASGPRAALHFMSQRGLRFGAARCLALYVPAGVSASKPRAALHFMSQRGLRFGTPRCLALYVPAGSPLRNPALSCTLCPSGVSASKPRDTLHFMSQRCLCFGTPRCPALLASQLINFRRNFPPVLIFELA